jgi:heat shock protein HslJ
MKFFMAVLITTILMSCSSAPLGFGIMGSLTLPLDEITENELTEKVWQLTEVRINGANIGFNRDDLTRIGLAAGEGFSLSFDAETVSGMGAPNRYIASYTRTDSQIFISSIAATEMAPLSGLDKLREQDYFNYLQNTGSWNFVKNNLELYSKTADGKEVILTFNPIHPDNNKPKINLFWSIHRRIIF